MLVIAGATAVGKSDLAIKLCCQCGGEVVSADSMQIYRGMDIGTGKVLPDQMCGIKHHMIDIVEPDSEFSVSDYVSGADLAIANITDRGKLAVVVGGTGFYIKGLLYAHQFGNAPADRSIRAKYQQMSEEFGAVAVWQRLCEVDELSAKSLHPNDTKRVIRALEIYEVTGVPKSAMRDATPRYPDARMVALTLERDELYSRINRRVDAMVRDGLIDEVASLVGFSNCNSMQAIGYKEIMQYLSGQIAKNEAIERVKQNSRNYAKRQLTYLRSLPNVIWLDASDNNILRTMSDIVTRSSI